MKFFTYPKDQLPDLNGYILLTLDAPPLTLADRDHGLFLIDGTWRHAATMIKMIPDPTALILRSLPKQLRTAYPRRQNDCPHPEQGLASVEALFSAYQILNRDTAGLLDHYYWKKEWEDLLNSLTIGGKSPTL